MQLSNSQPYLAASLLVFFQLLLLLLLIILLVMLLCCYCLYPYHSSLYCCWYYYNYCCLCCYSYCSLPLLSLVLLLPLLLTCCSSCHVTGSGCCYPGSTCGWCYTATMFSQQTQSYNLFLLTPHVLTLCNVGLRSTLTKIHTAQSIMMSQTASC